MSPVDGIMICPTPVQQRSKTTKWQWVTLEAETFRVNTNPWTWHCIPGPEAGQQSEGCQPSSPPSLPSPLVSLVSTHFLMELPSSSFTPKVSSSFAQSKELLWWAASCTFSTHHSVSHYTQSHLTSVMQQHLLMPFQFSVTCSSNPL